MEYLNTDAAPVSSPSAQVTIIAEHGTAYNEILQPTSYVATTHYFLSRWAAEIGGTGVMLILQLRALGYYNPTTQERRENITISLPELAKRCKVSVPTLKREMANNKSLQQFVSREPQYRRDKTGNVYRTENAYHIRMDDPMHPSDVPAFRAKVEAAQKGAHDGMAQNEWGSKDEPKRTKKGARYVVDPIQNEPMTVQSEPVRYHVEPVGIQNEPDPIQNEPALIDYSYLPKNTINTETTKTSPPAPLKGGAAFGAVSVSLLEQEAVEETEEEKAEKAAAALMAQARKEVYKRQRGKYLPDGELTRQVEERHQELKAEAAKEATQ